MSPSVRTAVADEGTSPRGGILQALRRSPLVGADLDVGRARETGRKVDDGFERRRAQAWVLTSEQARGQEFCPERNRLAAEREASEPRRAWMGIREHGERSAEQERARATFDTSYMAREENRRVIERHE